MVVITYAYAMARVAGALHNTGLYFGLVMAVLTTVNLLDERRCRAKERHDDSA